MKGVIVSTKFEAEMTTTSPRSWWKDRCVTISMLQRPSPPLMGPCLQGFLRRNPTLWHRSAATLSDPTSVSHTFMNGDGLLTITSLHIEAFYDALGMDLTQGHATPLVERLSEPFFRYCCDVDIKETILPTEELDIVGWTAHELLKSPCVLLTPKVDANANNPSAGGIHIVCPSMVVDRSRARAITAALTSALTQALPHRPWVKWIDDSIYRPGGGLRLLGSSKTKPCTQCCQNGLASPVCLVCKGRRSVAIPHRQYWIWSLVPANPSMLQGLQNIAWAVKYLSVRVAQSTAPATPLSIVPALAPPVASTPQRCALGVRRQRSASSPNILDYVVGVGGVDENVSNVSVSIDTLTRVLRNSHKAYAHITVAGRRQLSSTLMQVQVRGPGAHYCLNKGAPHHGNHIYFQISTHSGLEQRCYSSKRPCEGAALCSMWRVRLVHPLEPEVFLDLGLDPSKEISHPLSGTMASSWPQQRAANQCVLR